MKREDAIFFYFPPPSRRIERVIIGRVNELRSNNNCDETIDTAIVALRGPQPDPITGLMPCGCGGRRYCTMKTK